MRVSAAERALPSERCRASAAAPRPQPAGEAAGMMAACCCCFLLSPPHAPASAPAPRGRCGSGPCTCGSRACGPTCVVVVGEGGCCCEQASEGGGVRQALHAAEWRRSARSGAKRSRALHATDRRRSRLPSRVPSSRRMLLPPMNAPARLRGPRQVVVREPVVDERHQLRFPDPKLRVVHDLCHAFCCLSALLGWLARIDRRPPPFALMAPGGHRGCGALAAAANRGGCRAASI